MIQPRNTLVVIRIIDQPSRQVGSITVPTNNELYTEADILAIGPGNVSANGGRSETFDLAVGQRVWLQHKQKTQRGLQDTAIVYQSENEKFHIVEQTAILAILAMPGDIPEDKKVDSSPVVAASPIVLHA